MFNYHHARSAIKFKLFVLTIKGAIMTWLKTPEDIISILGEGFVMNWWHNLHRKNDN